MLVLVRAGTLGWARPLPVSSGGRDEGEVVCLLSIVRLRQEGGVVADPSLSIRPGLLGLAGPRSFGLSLTDELWALGLLSNRCLKTPLGYDPNKSTRATRDPYSVTPDE
jgi:hypothetical protein